MKKPLFGRRGRLCLASLALTSVSLGAGCGGGAGTPAPPTARAASRTDVAPRVEAEFVALKAETARTLKSGAKLEIPAGWWLRDVDGGVAFQDPDRELTITLVEIDADSTDAATTATLAKLGRTAPPKIARKVHEVDQAGWDEVAEIVWETPPSENRVFALNLRRQAGKTWASLLEGKTSAFARRGAQVAQIVLGLEVPGVAEEDLSSKKALALDAERLKELETFIERAREKAHVPGAAVALVQDGKVVFEKGFGVRERGKKDPVTPRTRFMIGSVTKSLSTLLIASLVDGGKVKWDAPVKELLPSFETGDAAFTGKLTLAHTFCACTGMPRRDLDLVFEYGAHKPEDAFSAFADSKPTTGFGETFQYSNQMTALGGFLAARIAEPGKPLGAAYAAAMKARVFGPMGMSDTTASFEEGRKGTVASPHGGNLVGPRDEPMVLPIAMERFVEPVAPAGAVFSTARDMARYALVELANGKTPEGKQAFGEASLLERRKARIRVGPRSSYGLGLATSTLRGLPVVTHDGGTFGFVTRLTVFPDKNLGLVVLTNTTSAGALFVDAVTQRLVEVAFGGKEQAARDLDRGIEQDREQWMKHHEKVAMPVPADVVARLTGTWKSERLGSFVFTSTKDGLRVDVGEWSSRLGYEKAEDGTARLFFVDPPVEGLPMTLEEKELVVAHGQESYRFTKK
ncbi:MAG: beta-lactamase family protein [Labilithrix sp.]|nr:beta-lactamase family protein [Labilithrix sp.]